jgi:Tol biopolymer transport system component
MVFRGRAPTTAVAIAGTILSLLAAAPGAARAAFPGHPGLIVFNLTFHSRDQSTYSGGLYAIRPGQKHPRQLTTSPWDYDPSFAPSGKRLVFRRARRPSPGLYTLDLGSGRTTRLTSREDDLDPALGPKGIIVFSRFFSEGSYDLVLRTPNGRLRRLTSGAGHDGEAVFTPDGQRIVFSRDHARYVPLAGGSDASPQEELYSVGIDGNGPQAMRTTPHAKDFDISPNGSRLAFDLLGEVSEQQVESTIWTQRLEGSGRSLVSENAQFPAYSPDGHRIAYSNYEGVWLRRADGRGRRTRVLQAEYSEGEGALAIQPTWQPLP